MTIKRVMVLVVVLASLALALPVLAAAPGEGTVYEGVSVPGIALGDTRAAVEASVGPPRSCVSNDDPPTDSSCTFDVEGGGWVGVRYQGPDGGGATGSDDDVVANIRWNDEVVGWRTSAGITIADIYNDRQLAIDTYPNAVLEYEHGVVVKLTDYGEGISISWEAVYIFFNVSMSIFEPGAPPPPPNYIRVAGFDFSYDRKTITAEVRVVDEDNQPVEGASLSGFWVYPLNKNNNTSLFVSGTTNADGIATFQLASSRPGEYRLNIEQVSKAGFELDYDGSVLVGRFTRPKK